VTVVDPSEESFHNLGSGFQGRTVEGEILDQNVLRRAGIEEADALMIIGANPRKEAPILNARIRKRWLRGDFTLGLVGEKVDLTYDYAYLGAGADTLAGFVDHAPANRQKPMLLIGQGAFSFIVALGVMLYLAFFLLRDGERLSQRFADAAPLRPHQREALLHRFVVVIRATVKGSLVVAIVQKTTAQGLVKLCLEKIAPELEVILTATAPLAAGLEIPMTAAYLVHDGLRYPAVGLIAALTARSVLDGKTWGFRVSCGELSVEGECRLDEAMAVGFPYDGPSGAKGTCRTSMTGAMKLRIRGEGTSADLSTEDRAIVEFAEPAR